ncbi:hypothetical protein GSI_09270 [Ganoderma sinense ZZ0214-1]|uniref:Uncharacterized protein n=1 Tax=Ganoderma sinense ZZ0214-1 TaxID=1077348 RepID=A0A2G8S632_9APHY|nr:hypothetical protein GSI_09270 [Ganoderma sinense ZZ0214-1]
MSGPNCVIREVSKDVWTFSSPFSVMNIFPAKLRELGPVKWIIGADRFHHMFLADFKKEYPDAKVIAVDAAKMKKEVAGVGLKFDGVLCVSTQAWGADPPNTKYGFEDDIEHCYFSGFLNKDVAFLHKDSRTLIQADFLFNFPAHEQYSLAGGTPFFSWSSWNPLSWTNRKTVWWLGHDKEAMRRDVKTVANWDFDRIISCHGDVIETGGKKAWTEAYRDFLD